VLPLGLAVRRPSSQDGLHRGLTLSLGRTVLNIITVCFNDFVRAPAQTVLKVTGTAVTVIVLHQAALYAAEISKTPEGAWLRPAVRVIENNIGKLEKF
jgi:hypothetical protein